MKRLLVVIIGILSLAGCASAGEAKAGEVQAKDECSSKYDELYKAYQKAVQLYLQEKQSRIRLEGQGFAGEVQEANKRLQGFKPKEEPVDAKNK